MPKTLLAVDDSATMRKVLEITFSGEDFRVLSAGGRDEALAKLNEGPQVVVVDTVLDGEDGYALAKEIRARDPHATLVLLASRHNPYDAQRGRDSGADDFMDKPFDTQQMIDRVRKAMLSREAAGQTSGPTPYRSAPAPRESGTITNPPTTAPSANHVPSPPRHGVPGTQPAFARTAFSAGTPAGPRATLSFESGLPPNVTPPPSPLAAPPAQAVAAPVFSGAAGDSAQVPAPNMSAVVNGSVGSEMSGKLAELGLTQAQVDAVLNLSREVVERVVWEVVPQMAEALIKEEIARLMHE